MDNFPRLTTNTLILRKIKPGDLTSLLTYCNNPKISDQILNIPYPYSEEDAIFRMNFIYEGFKKKERYVFAITFCENDELIGEIGLHLDKTNDNAQLGYWVGEPFWGRKVATEATHAILKFGFEQLGLHKIYATHFRDNSASAKVMQNNKMIQEADLKQHYKVRETYRDVIQYRLTKVEYAHLTQG